MSGLDELDVYLSDPILLGDTSAGLCYRVGGRTRIELSVRLRGRDLLSVILHEIVHSIEHVPRSGPGVQNPGEIRAGKEIFAEWPAELRALAETMLNAQENEAQRLADRLMGLVDQALGQAAPIESKMLWLYRQARSGTWVEQVRSGVWIER